MASDREQSKWASHLAQLKSLAVGKRLPTAIYVHRSLLPELPQSIRSMALEKLQGTRTPIQWNVFKFSTQLPSLSLLEYPGFDEDAFPRLRRSLTIDLESGVGRERSYPQDDGAFILHRKELLVGENYPLREEFELVTREAEDAGLFKHTSDIGRLGTWKQRLAAAGYQLVDGRMLRADIFAGPANWQAQRGRTALSRAAPSLPLQAMHRQGWLNGLLSVLDYGCGRGGDLKYMTELGVNAWGWDPAHAPDGLKSAADLVNLGFVVNVIEDSEEREFVIESAFKLSRRALVVAAMIAPPSQFERFLPFRDGVVTSRGTFQKYFSQTELKMLVERSTGREAFGIAPGVVVAFRDVEFREQYIESRFRRRAAARAGGLRKSGRADRSKAGQLLRENREVCDTFWQAAVERGRWPDEGECPESEAAGNLFGSARRAAHALARYYDQSQLEAAAQTRREDLLVSEVAGALTRGHSKISELPTARQIEIRHFFGSHRALREQARELLAAMVEPEALEEAAAASDRRLCGGYWDGRGLTIERRCIERLPTLLRSYVELGGAYHGGLEGIDLVRVHFDSGKLTLTSYDDFYAKALPLLSTRTKVDLRRQRIDDFEYGEGFLVPPLFWKSRILAEDAPEYAKQQRFDARLDDLGLAPDDDPRFGFSAAVVDEVLTAKGLEVRGFRFYKTR